MRVGAPWSKGYGYMKGVWMWSHGQIAICTDSINRYMMQDRQTIHRICIAICICNLATQNIQIESHK